MKKNYFFLFSMLLPLSLSAQQSGYSSALIAKSEEMKTINVEKCAHGSFHHCCHTDLFTEARKNQASLTTQAQAYFKTTVLRPTLSGTALVYNTPHFAIHYTKSGLDAVPLADVNPANSIPDYVDFMAAVFDTVYVRAQREKYTMPPSDGTAGGSALYDVYIQQLGVGLYGYCQPETQVNDNPNSPAIVETDAMTSYMAMNNSYTWTTSTDTSVKVTCAHEFFHAIQFGYESNDSDFLYEATAVWMEDHRFPGLDDNLQYLPDFFQDPDVALDWSDYVDGSAYSGHFYSSWIYFKHMTDYTADSIIKTILINSINNSDLVGIDLALQDYGKNFKDDFRDFLIANLLLIDSLNYPQYSYPRADVYKNYIAQVPYNLSGPKIEGTINYTGTYQDFLSYSSGNSRLMRLSADYINIFPNQNCYINMIPVHPAVAFGLVVVAKDPAGNFLVMNPQKQGNDFYVDVNNQASYTKYTAIVYRDDINVPNHNSENYDLNVGNSITTGLKAISSSSDIKIYPNPLMDELTVETTGFNGAKMTIMDLFGREVYSGTLQASRELINTSTLGNGIYLLSLKEADKTVFIQKIIVNK